MRVADLARDIDQAIREVCRANDLGDNITDKLARQSLEKIAPIVQNFLKEGLRNIKAMNLGFGKTQITGEVAQDAMNMLRDFARTGDITPVQEKIQSIKLGPGRR